jgi:nucleotide-binding universal stress UspA family protein
MKFLVPVDFSSNSINASTYAAELARATNSSLIFLHVVVPFVDDNTYLSTDLATVINEAGQQLDDLVRQAVADYKISAEGMVLKGDVVSEILRTASIRKADLIIMGTHSVSPLMKFLFGSTTTSVISKTSAAVLAIPDNVSYMPPQHFVYASDYENSDIESLGKLAKIAAFFNAEINVVHVAKEYEASGTELSIIDYFSELVTKHIPYPNIVCRTLKNDNIAKGIEIFSETVGANIIALADRKHSLLDKLLNTSVTREFIYRGNLPLLVFHQHEFELVNEFS